MSAANDAGGVPPLSYVVAVVVYAALVAPGIWCHTESSSDLSHAYVSDAVSAVEAVILNVAAAGDTMDVLAGCADIDTTLVTVSVAVLLVVLEADVLESQTNRYCHPLYE